MPSSTTSRRLEWLLPLLLAMLGFAGTVWLVAVTDPLNDLARALSLPMPWMVGFLVASVVFLLFRWPMTMSAEIRRRAVAEEALAQERDRVSQLLNSIGDAVLSVAADGRISYANEPAGELLGQAAEALLGQRFDQLLDLRHTLTGEAASAAIQRGLSTHQNVRLTDHRLHRDGDIDGLPVALTVSGLRDRQGILQGMTCVFRPVEREWLARDRRQRETRIDPESGCLNRDALEGLMSHALDDFSVTGIEQSLCYLQFHAPLAVHELHVIGSLLRDPQRAGEVIARVGEREFAILLPHCTENQAQQHAAVLRRRIQASRDVSCDVDVVVMGLCADQQPSDVLADAASRGGRAAIDAWKPNPSASDAWQGRIRDVIEQDDLLLLQQAALPLQSSDAEALTEIYVRVPEQGVAQGMPPAVFFPFAERCQLLPALDRRVVARVLDQLACKDMGITFVNLSEASLYDRAFCAWLVEAVRISGLAQRLCFETGEQIAARSLNAVSAVFADLKAAGCAVALDQYGAGWSSLRVIGALGVDYVKLDHELCVNVVHDRLQRTLIESIVKVAHTMGAITIATHVETRDALEALRDAGVDYAQGYVVGRETPLSVARPAEAHDAAA